MISPTVRRLRLAAQLAHLRQTANVTLANLAASCGINRIRLSAFEQGQRLPTSVELFRIGMSLSLDTTGPTWTELSELWTDASASGWWFAHRPILGDDLTRCIDIETGATHVRSYHLTDIPDLLCTRQVRRHLLEQSRPPRSIRDIQTIQDISDARHRAATGHHDVVLDESLLTRPIAPAPLHAEQLDVLAAVADASDVTVRILPLRTALPAWRHPGLGFALYDYADPQDPPVVLHALDGHHDLLHRPDEIAEFRTLHHHLWAASFDPATSADLLTTGAHALRAL